MTGRAGVALIAGAVLVSPILRRAARAVTAFAELVDDALAPFDHEETP